MLLTSFTNAQQRKADISLNWDKLPPIPDKHGFAGSFAGVSNGALIVAGGANFPDGGAPWTGSKKAWTDKIFVLEKRDGQWKEAGILPTPLGYGVSVSWRNQLICFGGSNSDRHSELVLSISYKDGKLIISKLADMPATLANSTGALAANIVYIAGGLEKPDDNIAGKNFWSLDLSQPTEKQRWQVLQPWPGPERMLSVSGTTNDKFYLFSGAALTDDGKGSVKRIYLKDSYQYSPTKGWKKLANMPQATVAAPNPAYAKKGSGLFVFGGDDGKLVEQASELKDRHPGFSDQILGYNIIKNSWYVAGRITTHKKEDAVTNPNASVWAPVTNTMAVWNGSLVFPGGEVRPAVRTPNVLRAVLR